uniref:GULP PTB domain containing engulfment adaptor 1a n=1 Tax=Eptatretus burgeri TaxID=7764 RepID=A0A8C4NCV2_EPTBU
MNRTFGRKKDKTWIHTPETLTKSCVSYSVKFLGSCEVDLPKGSEIVKDAIRKLKFACQLKKSEGQKIPKVELQISIRGIQILDPKSKEIQHNCQLQRISFCADDKTDKHIFTFICKDGEQSKHLCFVFDSEKSSSQAFNGVPPTDPFDMVPFSLTSEASFSPTNQGLPPSPSSAPTLPPPIPSRAAERGTSKDVFGADPFDPFNSPVNSQPKCAAIQDNQGGGTTKDTVVLLFDPLDSKC